ncbi:hypothetical protein predicted by Glimmer/Critica [Acetobacter ghanensis]|uniref:Uncharacterized protein n=1 Tax=Acetobacter ghanensis TaxID=431306 RepID=A0A0U5F2F4_9PROT|nr:hypothetical protein predicted by Glimmer/Critica [Acetobacter ghanensis]
MIKIAVQTGTGSVVGVYNPLFTGSLRAGLVCLQNVYFLNISKSKHFL